MPLYFALLLSLLLHTALIVAPTWLAARPRPPSMARIETRILPPLLAPARAEAVSTDADRAVSAAAPPPPAAAKTLQGRALRRAEAALAEHLFYPPEAIALGLEGEVILLLVLAEDGRLLSAAVARGSGHALLDQAALEAARGIGALPGSPRQTLFPVRFRLQ